MLFTDNITVFAYKSSIAMNTCLWNYVCISSIFIVVYVCDPLTLRVHFTRFPDQLTPDLFWALNPDCAIYGHRNGF